MEALRNEPITLAVDWNLNPYQVLRCFKAFSHPVLLESGCDPDGLGRYSILGCDPSEILETKKGNATHWISSTPKHLEGDPLQILETFLSPYKSNYRGHLPFYGGALGYFSYDLKNQLEALPQTAIEDIQIPDIWMGLYHWGVIWDHLEGKTYLVFSEWLESPEEKRNEIESLIAENKDWALNEGLEPRQKEPQIETNMTKEAYVHAINRVREYIRSGDIYQANFTQRFQTTYEGSAVHLFGKLRLGNPAPFSAYIDLGETQIVSASPERFIRLKDGCLEARPIKGTRPRGKTPEEDAANREELINSEKDQSELLMIVDLERNDLSRVAVPGTVKVTELFKLETYATVFHLVATVIAQLQPGKSLCDCIRATFPGGSITGAPKIRAMEVIDELEPTARNLYTGSIGYIGFNGNSDLSIVIRTILCQQGTAWFQTGGGIVWDSDPYEEYEECLHKARGQIRALSI